MNDLGHVSRMRVFAGPNGSGKSLLKTILPLSLVGKYVNPDELENQLQKGRAIDLNEFGVRATSEELYSFFRKSGLMARSEFIFDESHLTVNGQKVIVTASFVNSYLASILADFLRHKLLDAEATFSFETVMSSPDKIQLMHVAKALGYRTYLYYVATESPEINVVRVRNRVSNGGHSVPEDKITSRYYRSLQSLPDAIAASNRAFIFDNSAEGGELTWMAEITDGHIINLKASPSIWFRKYVLDMMVLES